MDYEDQLIIDELLDLDEEFDMEDRLNKRMKKSFCCLLPLLSFVLMVTILLFI